jgi:hypothetical protein
MKAKQERFVRLFAVLVLTAAAGASQALDISPVIKGGYDTGGDTLINVIFTDGSTESIKANEGFYFGGGVSILNDDGTLEAELTVAYKAEIINASNGKLKFTRIPLEALGFYRWPKFRLGGGLTYHMDASLDGSGVASPVNRNYDDAAGFVLQGDYLVNQKFSIGLRYTSIEYKQTNTGAKFKGDGVGFTVGYRF